MTPGGGGAKSGFLASIVLMASSRGSSRCGGHRISLETDGLMMYNTSLKAFHI
jgi:hypothetical protein